MHPARGSHGGDTKMLEERNEVAVPERPAPRWIGIVVAALAVISLVALGVGWSAANRSKALEQSLASQTHQITDNDNVLGQRLAKAEDINAQLQGELSVVTDKMKLTETELTRARSQTRKIKDENAKELGYLPKKDNGALATTHSADV